MRGARMRCDDYAAGIWPWDCDDTVIQFNEVSGLKGTKDGEAFDSDAYTRNTLFQYNYTHDNDGGFLLICCSDNTGTVVRYNISQNDRARLFHMADSNVDMPDLQQRVLHRQGHRRSIVPVDRTRQVLDAQRAHLQ